MLPPPLFPVKHDCSVANVAASKVLYCPGQMTRLDEVLGSYLGRREKLPFQLPEQGAAGPGAWGTGSYQVWHLGTEERYGVLTHGLHTRCLYVFHKASCYSPDLN